MDSVANTPCPFCCGSGYLLDPGDGSCVCCERCGGGGLADDVWLGSFRREQRSVGATRIDFIYLDIMQNGEPLKQWGWSEEALRDKLIELGFGWAER